MVFMKFNKQIFVIIAIIIGNSIEWLEFTLFAYLSHKIAPIFFPHDSSSLASLKTYMIFATSYLARPIGSFIFGYIGDRTGRLRVLKNSLMMMSLATASIALLPSYHQIGLLSPLLLAFFRIAQGLSISGEFNSSQLVLIEHFGKNKPYAIGVLGPLSASFGMILGSLFAALVYSELLPDWSWRLVFFMSSILGFIGFYLRRFLDEPKVFTELKEKGLIEKVPPVAAIVKNKIPFLLCFSSSMFISNFVYIGSFFYEKIAVLSSQINETSAHNSIIMGQILATFTMFVAIFFINKVKHTQYCLITLFLAIIFSPLMILCALSKNLVYIYTGQIIYGVINGLVSAVLITFVCLQFPPQTRLSGSSLAWSLGTAIFGGSSLLIGEILRSNGYSELLGFYISTSALCPFLVILYSFSKNKKRNPLTKAKLLKT